MKLSFVIPAYNEAKGIRATLDQFKALEQIDHEIIVTDNGSTDDTAELARSLGGTVVLRPTDKRTTIGECRNRGAKAATGDVIWFIDADVLIPDLANTASEVLQSFSAKPNMTALVMRITIYPAEATRADRFWFGMVNVMTYAQNRIIKVGGAPGDSIMVRRSAFEKIHGFNSILATSEDHDLLKRLTKIGEVGMLWHRKIEMSPRRVHRDGWPKVLGQWGKNWINQFIFHKEDHGEWEARR